MGAGVGVEQRQPTLHGHHLFWSSHSHTQNPTAMLSGDASTMGPFTEVRAECRIQGRGFRKPPRGLRGEERRRGPRDWMKESCGKSRGLQAQVRWGEKTHVISLSRSRHGWTWGACAGGRAGFPGARGPVGKG